MSFPVTISHSSLLDFMQAGIDELTEKVKELGEKAKYFEDGGYTFQQYGEGWDIVCEEGGGLC